MRVVKKWFRQPVLIAAAILLGMTGCAETSPAQGPQSEQGGAALPEETEPPFTLLTFGTADSGGSMYMASLSIASALTERDDGIRYNIIASTGSAHNVSGLMEGDLDLALVSGDVALAALEGREEFQGKPAEKLRAIGAIYPSLSNWMALRENGLHYVHDLRGYTAVIGPEGSATERAARLALQKAGITETDGYVNGGLGSGADKVAAGELTAVHGFAGTPIPGLAKLAEEKDCVLLGYTDEELLAVTEAEPCYYAADIPAGTYPDLTEAVHTFGVKCLLCVNEDMDPELAYHLTELILDALPGLKENTPMLGSIDEEGFICSNLPIPLHEGAERYYREKGMLEE